jgi:adenosylmethionine-8-amino-7-oxononanoate aminotransferase
MTTAAAQLTAATAQRHLLLHMTDNGSLATPGQELFVVRRGEGPYVDDADGNRYIDGLSGLYCCQLGYSYGPEFAEAAERQLRGL